MSPFRFTYAWVKDDDEEDWARYNVPDDDWYNVMNQPQHGQHFTTIESFTSFYDAPTVTSLIVDNEDGWTDTYGGSAFIFAPTYDIGGYYFISYGPLDLDTGILNDNEKGMDLNQEDGTVHTTMFNNAKGYIQTEADSSSQLVDPTSLALLAAMPWGLAASAVVATTVQSVLATVAIASQDLLAPDEAAASGWITSEKLVVNPNGAKKPYGAFGDISDSGNKTVQETADLSGPDMDVVVGSQVFHVLRINSQVYAKSQYWNNVRAKSFVALQTVDDNDAFEFEVLAWLD